MRNLLHYLIGYGGLGYLGYIIYLSANIYLEKSDRQWCDLYMHYYIIGGVALFLAIIFLIPIKVRSKAKN